MIKLGVHKINKTFTPNETLELIGVKLLCINHPSSGTGYGVYIPNFNSLGTIKEDGLALSVTCSSWRISITNNTSSDITVQGIYLTL